MSIKNKFAALIIATCFTFPAIADQALYISKENANRAINLLKNVSIIKLYCAPCGDTSSKSITINKNINKIRGGNLNYLLEGYWRVQINGEGVDLAYIYFPYNNKWRNVAITLNIPVQYVPEYID